MMMMMMNFHDVSLALNTCDRFIRKGEAYGVILIEEEEEEEEEKEEEEKETELAEHDFLYIVWCMVPCASSLPMVTDAFACVLSYCRCLPHKTRVKPLAKEE